jgi:hypothetical protein
MGIKDEIISTLINSITILKVLYDTMLAGAGSGDDEEIAAGTVRETQEGEENPPGRRLSILTLSHNMSEMIHSCSTL